MSLFPGLNAMAKRKMTDFARNQTAAVSHFADWAIPDHVAKVSRI